MRHFHTDFVILDHEFHPYGLTEKKYTTPKKNDVEKKP